MGVKLKKIVTQGGLSTTTEYAGNFIYENGALQFFSHPEGYVTPDGMGGYDYIYQYRDHLGNVRLSYMDQSLRDAFYFESDTEGWYPTGSTQLTNTNQKLNISITNRWNTANQYYDVTPGVPIHIAFDFEQGDMLNPYFFVRERIDGVWESNANRDLIASMTDGHYELELTPTGDHIRVYFEKATASDNGTQTTCYVDNLTITQDHLEIVQENNYYPFGLQHKGYNDGVSPLGNSTAQRWRFGGKEYQEELGLEWYDITARNYDPALGRWMNIDPLAEQMRRHSSYNYAFNNPIIFQDPDGMAPFTDLFDKNGKKVGSDGVDNGVKIVVTDNAKANEISKIEGNVNLDEVGLSADNAVVLPDDATLQESLNVLDRQVANGGKKEEASTVVENGRRINRSETGSMPTITKQKDGTYSATAETKLPETPLLPGEEVTASIHSHPTEAIEKDGQVFLFSANVPTPGSDTEAFKNFRTNVIVGPIGGKVTRGSDGKLIDTRTKGVSIFNSKSQLQISLPAKTVKKILGN